jgi:DNA-binding phage protein
MTRKRAATLKAQLLRLILDRAGDNLTALARATGMDQSVLYRFTTGERDLSLKNIDRLLSALGYQVKLIKKESRP